MGLPLTATARSGGGDGHIHYYYERPTGIPQTRINRSGEYDLQTQGYFVAPPSIHPSGNPYIWTEDTSELPMAPAWSVNMLEENLRKREAPSSVDWTAKVEPTINNLSRDGNQAWCDGTRFVLKEDGTPDRSRTLFHIAGSLLAQGQSPEQIVLALADKDEAFGFPRRRGSGRGWTDEWDGRDLRGGETHLRADH